MSGFADFWERKQATLDTEEYADDMGPLFCEPLAREIAGVLKQEGGRPYLLFLSGVPDGLGEVPPLFPRKYAGNVKWMAHCVCAQSDIVYDLILPEPTPLDTYGLAAFGAEVRVTDAQVV